MSDSVCNLCGHTLYLTERPTPRGLVNTEVTGGYESTPGNGFGALDDNTTYKFSLCEFCLDWLFSQFKVPPVVTDPDGLEPWRPAEQRIREDSWRRMESEFLAQAKRRAKSRGA